MNLQILYLRYLSEEDLGLNKLQWLIYYKTQPNSTKPNQSLIIFRNKNWIELKDPKILLFLVGYFMAKSFGFFC